MTKHAARSSITVLLVGAATVLMSGCGSEQVGTLAVPVRAGRVTLEFGQADGPDAYVFGQIGGATVDAAGRIIVADAQAGEVRVFDPEGGFLFRVARKGAGPGEVVGPCCLFSDERGQLWVRDTGNGRYNAYLLHDTAATFVSQRRMSHSAAGFWNPLTLDGRGNLIDIGMVTGEEVGVMDVVRNHLDSLSQVVVSDTIPSPPRDSLAFAVVEGTTERGRPFARFYWQPYGPRHLITHSALGGWAEVVSSTYRIRWHQPGGGPPLVIEARIRPPAVTAEERASAEEALEDRLDRSGLTLRDLPFTIPDQKQPLRALYFDRSGRLWAEVSTTQGTLRRADVYDRRGEHSMTVEWYADVDLSLGEIHDVFAIGVRRDDLGVEQIVRVEW